MQRVVSALTSRLVIAIPYLWLIAFFLIPFFIVFKISLSQTASVIRLITYGEHTPNRRRG